LLARKLSNFARTATQLFFLGGAAALIGRLQGAGKGPEKGIAPLRRLWLHDARLKEKK